MSGFVIQISEEDLEEKLATARAEAREVCAKLCDEEMAGSKRLRVERETAARLAVAIRALGDKP